MLSQRSVNILAKRLTSSHLSPSEKDTNPLLLSITPRDMRAISTPGNNWAEQAQFISEHLPALENDLNNQIRDLVAQLSEDKQDKKEEKENKYLHEYINRLKNLISEVKETATDTQKLNIKVVKRLKLAKSVAEVIVKGAAAGLLVFGINIQSAIENIAVPISYGIGASIKAFGWFKNIRKLSINDHEIEKQHIKKKQPKTRATADGISSFVLSGGSVTSVLIGGITPLTTSFAAGLSLIDFLKQCAITYLVRRNVSNKRFERDMAQACLESYTMRSLMDLKSKENHPTEYHAALKTHKDKIIQYSQAVDQANEKLAKAKQDRFLQQRKLVFKGLAFAGAALMVAGFLFPPLQAVGAVILVGSAIVDVVDSFFDYKISKAVVNTVSKLKQKFNSFFHKADSTPKPKPTKTPSNDLDHLMQKGMATTHTTDLVPDSTTLSMLQRLFSKPGVSPVQQQSPMYAASDTQSPLLGTDNVNLSQSPYGTFAYAERNAVKPFKPEFTPSILAPSK